MRIIANERYHVGTLGYHRVEQALEGIQVHDTMTYVQVAENCYPQGQSPTGALGLNRQFNGGHGKLQVNRRPHD